MANSAATPRLSVAHKNTFRRAIVARPMTAPATPVDGHVSPPTHRPHQGKQSGVSLTRRIRPGERAPKEDVMKAGHKAHDHDAREGKGARGSCGGVAREKKKITKKRPTPIRPRWASGIKRRRATLPRATMTPASHWRNMRVVARLLARVGGRRSGFSALGAVRLACWRGRASRKNGAAQHRVRKVGTRGATLARIYRGS